MLTDGEDADGFESVWLVLNIGGAIECIALYGSDLVCSGFALEVGMMAASVDGSQ